MILLDLEVFENIIDSSVKESINAEYSFKARSLKDVTTDKLVKGSIITVDNQKFRVTEISDHGCNAKTIEFSADHISYDLASTKKTIEGMLSADSLMSQALSGTGFTNALCTVTGSINCDYTDATAKEILLDIAKTLNSELVFDNYDVSLVATRGQDRGISFEYGKNLKAITRYRNSKGTGYKVDIVELGLITGLEEDIFLGDSVEIIDATLGISTKQRILSIEYNPFLRIHTNLEIGQRELTAVDALAEMIDEVVKESVKDIEPELIYNQIVEVTKETVLAVETIHATTAWIEELEVNYLRTNFEERFTKAGQSWDYIYGHGMQIEFNTASLDASEEEQYKTASGKTLYWTAIGAHPDAKKYFTLQKPNIPEGSTAVESDFFVMVPKINSQATKMKISFETIPGGTGLFPIMEWGQGNGQGSKGGKAFVFKDVDGLNLQYFVNDDKYSAVKMDADGIRVFTNTETSLVNKQVRNIFYVEDEAAMNALTAVEGDIVLVKVPEVPGG